MENTMAVPKKKTSPCKRGMRNAHRTIPITLVKECGNCGSLIRPHHVCDVCGHYKNRKVMLTRNDKKRIRDAQKETV